MLHSSTNSTSRHIHPRFSHTNSVHSDMSMNSVGAASVTTMARHGHYKFSKQLINNKSWIKIQVDSIHFDLKNDEYEIKLSDCHIMSFHFASKTCSMQIPSNKVQIERTIHNEQHEENEADDYEDTNIEQIIQETDAQTGGLEIDKIESDWKQLGFALSHYASSNTNTPRKNIANNHKHKPSQFHYKPCSLPIEHCPHIQHIVFILNIYMKYLNYKTKQVLYTCTETDKFPVSVTQIIDILPNYDKIQLLNDYLHIKKQHYNNNEFHELQSYLQLKTPQCTNMSSCICCTRNKENNQIYKHLSSKTRRDLYLINNEFADSSVEEMDEINLQKYIDTIHSTLIHQLLSDDINYKFSTNLLTETPSHSHASHDEEEKSTLHGMDGSEYDFLANGGHSDEIHDENSSFYNVEEYQHKFGQHTKKFSYWNTKSNDYISPIYTDLKTELLCHGMTNNDYQILHQRAIDFLQCKSAQNMSCKRQFSWMCKKTVKMGEKISVNHIIAIMVYTNYINLRDKLINNGFKCSTTTTVSSEHDSFQEFKQRHCEIAHFCRLLKETIYCFGDSLHDRSRLYHGIDCKLMFNKVEFAFNIPMSTTIKYSIAPVSSHGLCLKFGKPILANQKNYYFDVSDISQFPDEKERIVFGGEALGFLDIIYNGHSHCEQIMSLRLFRQIIQGHWFTNNKELMKTKYQRRIIKFINSLMINKKNEEDDSHNYMMQLFTNISILYLKENTIWINRSEMELLLPELKKLFFNKFEKHLVSCYDSLQIKYCDILEMHVRREEIESSSFRKSIYSSLYTYKLNDNHNGEKVSFVFRCFQKYDQSRKENMFRGFVAIKYLPKAKVVNQIDMRYGLYFPQKIKLSKWENCVLSPTALYKGSSLFSINEIKHIDMLQIKICFQIIKVQ